MFIKQSSECSLFCVYIKVSGEDFLVGPAVGNPPASSGDMCLTPGPGRPHMPQGD